MSNHKYEKQGDIVSDLLALYELSLANGRSLKPEESCSRFLDVFMARKSLGMAAVWMSRKANANETWPMLYARPSVAVEKCEMSEVHQVRKLVKPGQSLVIDAGKKKLGIMREEPTSGCYLVFDLIGHGVLVAYTHREKAFKQNDLNRLRGVIEQFANTLTGSVAYKDLLHELDDGAKREAELLLFRRLIDQTNDGIYVIDSDTSALIDVNETACEMLGYKREELLGKKVVDFSETVSTVKAWNHIQERQIRNKVVLVESLHIHKSGRKIPVEVNSRRIQVSGKYINLAVVRDVSERKQTEEALRTSEARYKSLFSNIKNAVIVLKIDEDQLEFVIQDINQAAEKIQGVNAEEVRSKRITEVFPGVLEIGLMEMLHRVERTGRPEWLEATYYQDYRMSGWREFYIYKLKLGELVVVFQDVTQRINAAEALKRERSLLKSLIDSIPDLIYYKNESGTYIGCNKAFAQFANISAEKITGLNDFNLFPPDTAEFFREHDREMLEQKHANSNEEWVDYPNGERVLLETIKTPYIGPDDEMLGLIGVSRDITERKQNELKLRQGATVFEFANEGMVILDENLCVLESNAAFRKMVASTNKELMAKKITNVLGVKEEVEFIKNMKEGLKEEGGWRSGVGRKGGEEEKEDSWFSITRVDNAKGMPERYVVTLTDISELRQTREKLTYLAHHDPLTGLPNRMLFMDRLNHAVRRSDRTGSGFTMVFIDLDNFKNINDSLGHGAGDQLLVQVAERITLQLRVEDTFARLGGDEFTILLEGVDGVEGASIVAERIMSAFTRTFVISGQEIYATGSMGVGVYPRDGNDAEMLMRNADSAMYQAKNKGRNAYYFYSTHMTDVAAERLRTVNELKTALDKNEFELLYQPQVDLKTGEVKGFEALLRWNHPVKGVLEPSEFLTLAEETRLLEPIEDWVFKSALDDAKQVVEESNTNLIFSVNVTSARLHEEVFLEELKSEMNNRGLAHESLVLEVTESALLSDKDSSACLIDELNQEGLHIYLDDFGTGYSSLLALRDFKFNGIKLDSNFVSEIDGNETDQVIAKSAIELAHKLGVKVIAEGAETYRQINVLTQLGCDQVQGYYLDKPFDLSSVRQLLKKSKPYIEMLGVVN